MTKPRFLVLGLSILLAIWAVFGCRDLSHEPPPSKGGRAQDALPETLTLYVGSAPGGVLFVFAPYDARDSRSKLTIEALATPDRPAAEHSSLAQLWISNESDPDGHTISFPAFGSIITGVSNEREFSDAPWSPTAAAKASKLVRALAFLNEDHRQIDDGLAATCLVWLPKVDWDSITSLRVRSGEDSWPLRPVILKSSEWGRYRESLDPSIIPIPE